jgi:hypothetical protein
MLNYFISLGLDKGGCCHELFLRGKAFLSQRITPIQGRNHISSRKILPDFYMAPFLLESETKNLQGAKNLPKEAAEPTRHQETYLPPMSQTHLPVCEAATNLQLVSFGNLFRGSPVMQVSHQQYIAGRGPVNLFEGSLPILKQELEPPVNRIRGSAQFPAYVTSSNSQTLSLWDLVRESLTMQSQQEGSHNPVWARQDRPLYK